MNKPIDRIKESISNYKSFVLQGGAGSGKTETLKETIQFVKSELPNKKLVCITHTNFAVDQIKNRISGEYFVSTIHAFIYDTIKLYKKNIHTILYKIFVIERVERKDISYYEDEKEQNKKEHDNYKKIHNKYAGALFNLKSESFGKPIGKREYDKDPHKYNDELNEIIDTLNDSIKEFISEKDFNEISYNESKFDSLHDLSFGHNSLLIVANKLFEHFPLLRKILQDKFDVILVDEYQDTSKEIIELFMNYFQENENKLIGLFGDSMQSIYDEGIGNVNAFIKSGEIVRIDKEDNYRSSQEVVETINNVRNDGLIQKVALKESEEESDRKGIVEFYYDIDANKPNLYASEDAKDKYSNKVERLIEQAIGNDENYKQLKLTNKSIAKDTGFENLYKIFNDRYQDPIERIEKHLDRLMLSDLVNLCRAYKPDDGSPNYNFVITQLKKVGFKIKSIDDKEKINEVLTSIIESDKSATETLEIAFESEILTKSEKYLGYIERKNNVIERVSSNSSIARLREEFRNGNKTYNKLKSILSDLSEDDFDSNERDLKDEIFFEKMFSDEIKFSELLNFYKYINEECDYLTMHKTKGGEIENVIVVLDEYLWSKYSFGELFSGGDNPNRIDSTRNLFYVACSRAKTNLKCVRILSNEDELTQINAIFKNLFKVDSY
ncbi:MAG: ATP-dependent helicase [Vicingaceae bacterium]